MSTANESRGPSIVAALTLMLACGCGVKPMQATDGMSSESSTSLQLPSSTSGLSLSDGSTQTSAPIPDLPTDACDIWLETCPAGQKCMPVSTTGDGLYDAHLCRPVVPEADGLYDPCKVLGTPFDGLDTCEEHMICVDADFDGVGVCWGMCIEDLFGETDCVDPRARCWVYEGQIFNLCHPFCDPLLLECGPSETCSFVPSNPASFFCLPDESGSGGGVFDPCESIAECKPGYFCGDPAWASECITPGATGCCLEFCDLTQPNTCPGEGLECLATFLDDYVPPPPELSHVGLCRLPT